MAIIKLIKQTFPLLPIWAKFIIGNLLALFVIVELVAAIGKAIATPNFKKVVVLLTKFFAIISKGFNRSMEQPVHRPRIELISVFSKMSIHYIFAFIIFAWFAVFLCIASADDVAGLKRMQAAFVGFFYLLFARWYFVLGEKERLTLIKQWVGLRRK